MRKKPTTPGYSQKAFDTRTKDYKDAKWALENKDITNMDKRSRAYKIFNALFDQQYGDAVKEFTDWLGFEQCDKCKERQKAWNKKKEELESKNTDVLVFKEDSILSDDDKVLLQNIWTQHMTTHQITTNHVIAFNELYRSVYGRKASCSTCGFMGRVGKVMAL